MSTVSLITRAVPRIPRNKRIYMSPTSVATAGIGGTTPSPGQVQPDWAATSGLGMILNKPTTLAGFNISVNDTLFDSKYLGINAKAASASLADSVPFAGISNLPTTLAGYGITDAQRQLNGTGFVKANGTTISYDPTNYLPLTGGILTGSLTTVGLESSKGGIFFGQYSTFPTGYGAYVANYVSSTYGARILAYDGTNYQKLTLGALVGSNFGLVLDTNNKATFGADPYVLTNKIWHAGNFNPANYLPLTGGNMTGALKIYNQNTGIWFENGGIPRFIIQVDNTESGSNTGSNYEMYRYDDSGTYLGIPFSIKRSTGVATFETTPYVGSNQILTSAGGEMGGQIYYSGFNDYHLLSDLTYTQGSFNTRDYVIPYDGNTYFIPALVQEGVVNSIGYASTTAIGQHRTGVSGWANFFIGVGSQDFKINNYFDFSPDGGITYNGVRTFYNSVNANNSSTDWNAQNLKANANMYLPSGYNLYFDYLVSNNYSIGKGGNQLYYNAPLHYFNSAIVSAGIESSKGGIFFGQYSTFPTGYGTYVANYVSSTYGARVLAYDGTNYQKLTLGALVGSTFGLTLGTDNKATFGGQAVSSDYTSAGFLGTGFKISSDVSEVQNLIVRGSMSVYELLINQVRGTNGSLVVSDSAKIQSVSGSTIYFDTKNGAMPVPFQTGDKLRCQQWTGSSVKAYFATVTGTGSNYITVTLSGTGTPAAGDILVRWNSSVAGRTGLLYLTSSDTNSPRMSIINNEVEVSRVGLLDGITDAQFGALSGYGIWTSNGYFTGTIKAGAGQIAGWDIQSTVITKGTVFLGSDGSIYSWGGSLYKWLLNNDGSGQVASGNIAWDASGNVTFSSAVALNWMNPINNIQVGGRNLVLNSYTNITINSAYGMLPLSVDIVAGQTYTMSAMVQSDAGGSLPLIILPHSWEYEECRLTVTHQPTKGIVSRTFVATHSGPMNFGIYVDSGTWTVYWVRLEIGNKPTDWTPAPEDTSSKLTHIDSTGIYTGTLTASQIIARTITADRIAAGAITAYEIASRTITADKIVAGSITATEINATSIQAATVTAGYINTLGITSLGPVTAGSFNLGSGKFVVDSGGNLSATNVNLTGTIHASAGSFGGFTIESNYIHSTTPDGEFSIWSSGFCGFTSPNYMAVIGNGLSAVTGLTCAGLFRNAISNSLSTNYGLIIDVRNADMNVAIDATGAINADRNSSRVCAIWHITSTVNAMDVRQQDKFYIVPNAAWAAAYLPSWSLIQEALGVGSTTNCTMKVTCCCCPNNNGWGTRIYTNPNETWVKYDANGNSWTYFQLGPGDAVTFWLTYYNGTLSAQQITYQA